jgi:GNAT superfamily N-acetyltransferase
MPFAGPPRASRSRRAQSRGSNRDGTALEVRPTVPNSRRPSGKAKAPVPAAIRLARPGDVPRLIEIRAAVRENQLSDPLSIGAADYAPYVAGARCWVWEAQGKVAGFAALDADAASVWALFVAPEFEGRGGGRSLLDRLLGEARRRGLAELRLSTGAASRAEHFYRSAGWEAIGEAGEGQRLMRLRLNPPGR